MNTVKTKPSSKHVNHHEGYYENMIKALDKRKREAPLKTYRKRIIDNQNKLNYQNEYDRIRGHLNSHSILAAKYS